MSTVDQSLAEGTRLHQAGRLAEAERIYRQILAAQPQHPHALHQLGMLGMQARQFEAAIALFTQAIRVLPAEAAFHANLGEALRHARRFDEAAQSYRRALALNPGLVPVHTALGVLLQDAGKLDEAAAEFCHTLRHLPADGRANRQLGIVLDHQGKYREAEACFRAALASDDSAEARFNLASTLHSQNRTDEAIAEYQAAIARQPNYGQALNNLATLLKARGQLAEAERHLQNAVAADANFAAARHNLALLYETQGRLDEAAGQYEAAIRSDPKLVAALQGLGAVRRQQGRLDEAMACFHEALKVDPAHADSHLGLAYLLQIRRRKREALEHFHEALRLRPDWPEAYNNLGVCYAGDGSQDEAIAALRRAVELRPDYAAAHSNLAVSLRALGLLDEAIEHHRQAVRLAPADTGQHSNLLYTLNYHPRYDAPTLFEEHRTWGRQHADPLTASAPPPANDRSPARRLKVGYVSPNFYSHAINFFVEPILRSHDHAQYEVFCYSDLDEPDETTERLRGYADQWRDTMRLTDEQLAERVRADGIDILVDLTGHISGGRRLLAFARRAAPVQVTYIGYQNTTGMLAMDYRLTDDYSDPPGTTDAHHTERLVRLPTTFFCYLPTPDAPPVGPLPADAAGYVTFGSVNSFTKITPQVLEAWAEILRHTGGSKLMIRADMTASLEARLREFFAARAIDPARLELVHRLPRPKYLELISRLDVALDPFPFNGHTTTCDCLWQGVPVVTLSGETYVSRFGGSGLATLGLHELIARSPEMYVQAAVALAEDTARLRGYRASLRQRMADSPLLDFATFTRNLEATYRRMWTDWCAAPSATAR